MIDVSIILPVYNSEDTIETTLLSIVNQKFIGKYELIVINDGSTDKSIKIINNYKKKYPNLLKIINKKNTGVSDSRNIGLSKAIGKYITFIDSDDLYNENYLQILYKKINQKYDIVSCSYKNFGANENNIGLESDFDTKKINVYIKELQTKYLLNQLWNKMYLKKIIDEYSIMFDINKSIAEDWEFNLKYLEHCKSFYHINEYLYNYRITNYGLGFKYRKDAIKIKFDLLDLTKKIYKKNKIVDNYIDECYIKQSFSFLSVTMDKRNNDCFRKKIEDISNFFNDSHYKKNINNIRTDNIKMKLLLLFIGVNNSYILALLGLLANKYDKKLKQKNFGVNGG